MNWTQELPAAIGWYWWKLSAEDEAQAVEVGTSNLGFVAFGYWPVTSWHAWDTRPVGRCGGWWHGPHEPPPFPDGAAPATPQTETE
jgi:hypothetical protein